jgi:regulator of sirC expression with transglutaminase-like and TPR domain
VSSDAVRRFSEAIMGPDHQVDLFGGAMVIAGISGHLADLHETARELDLIAEDVREYAGERVTDDALADAIDYQLFTVRGFHGNQSDYGNAENSYLDAVMRTRTGLPITLSLVYMEIADRVGLRCDGIGYPGHFIVRCGDPAADRYVDPFHQGNRLDRDELLAGLQGMTLGSATPESFLAALTRRQLLQRMLNHLHGLFRKKSQVLAEAKKAEKLREDALRDLGYEVVRVTWSELADPRGIAVRVGAALTRSRARRRRPA